MTTAAESDLIRLAERASMARLTAHMTDTDEPTYRQRWADYDAAEAAFRTAAQALADKVRELTDERDELQAIFDLRWKADMRAIKMWQEAHPGNDLVWPDHADVVVWLLETRP